jgi:hypothetical protein
MVPLVVNDMNADGNIVPMSLVAIFVADDDELVSCFGRRCVYLFSLLIFK